MTEKQEEQMIKSAHKYWADESGGYDKEEIMVDAFVEGYKQASALYNDRLLSFQKNRLDLLNWAKSELKEETHPKLGKRMTAYRSDRIIFLRRIVSWLNNEA